MEDGRPSSVPPREAQQVPNYAVIPGTRGHPEQSDGSTHPTCSLNTDTTQKHRCALSLILRGN